MFGALLEVIKGMSLMLYFTSPNANANTDGTNKVTSNVIKNVIPFIEKGDLKVSQDFDFSSLELIKLQNYKSLICDQVSDWSKDKYTLQIDQSELLFGAL